MRLLRAQQELRHEYCFILNNLMKKCLASALLALGLILDVQAQRVPTTTVRAVPDAGSTAMLLGLGLAALAVYRKKDQT